jgi:predicted NBD/HSP70 family sugar kinase
MKTRALPALPSSLRRLNERAVLQRLRRLGTATRADLAKAIGISQPTAGKIIDELLACGLLEELDESASEPSGNGPEPRRLGRPGRLIRLDAVHPRFLGIELGVEQTRLAPLPLSVSETPADTREFVTGHSPEAWARQLRQHAAALSAERLWGALVSVPGVVDEAAGRVLYSPNLHWTEQVHLAELIGQACALPVLLVQEIRALALGHQSAAPEAEDFLLVDFGEGVGGAVIEGGQLLSHPLPLSAELGHTPVPGNPRRCGCGAHGCVETLLSRRALAESFGRDDLAALAAAIARDGLPPWLRDALQAMGTVIAGALNVLGLRRVVITGHLTQLPPLVMATLADAVRRGAMWARFGEVICEAAPRRRLAGLVAAALDRLLFPASHSSPLQQAARLRMRRTAARRAGAQTRARARASAEL